MIIAPTNADRAAWAKDALAVFTARTFSGDQPDTMARDDLDCAIGDLITDLLHYAVRQGFDAGGLLQQACGNFGFELFEEACQAVTHQRLDIVPEHLDLLKGIIPEFEAYVATETDAEIRQRNQAWLEQARAAIANRGRQRRSVPQCPATTNR